MKKPAVERKLRWIEGALLASGIAFLLAFFLIKSDQSHLRADGLAAFYKDHPQGSELQAPNSKDDKNDLENPNQELWSKQRVQAFEESLEQVSDSPEGVLIIENLDIEVPIYNGTDEVILNRGVGRIIGTARMDGLGNLGLAGHRDGFFRGLKDIQHGELIELQTPSELVRYRVTSIVIVDPSDVSVLAPTEERTLTLVTCYPFYFVGHAPKRYIVKATAEQFLAIN
jgi:sortase A